MRFTLRQLQALVAINDLGSVSAASERLDISQSAVSSLIRVMEASLGFTLLVKRRGARAELTAAAMTLLPEARLLLDRAARIETTIDNLRRPEFREIRIGARPYLADRWLRDAMALFQRDNPHITVSLFRGTNEEILDGIAHGRFSAGFLMADRLETKLPHLSLGTMAASLYVSEDHPLARKNTVSVEEIAQSDFVLPPSGSALERRITSILQAIGIGSVSVVARTEYFEVLRMMTINNIGIGVMFDEDAKESLSNGIIHRLNINIPAVPIWKIEAKYTDDIQDKVAKFMSDHLMSHNFT